MAVRCVAAREAEYFAGDDTVAVQQDQAVYRADKLHVRVAPAHELRDWQFFQRLRDDFGQVGIERFAFLFKAGDEVLGFTVAGFLQLLEADARRAHESFERLGRLAFRVDAASHGRTFLLDDAIGLLRGDLADQQGQTAWRGIGRAEAVGRCEGLFFERGKNAVGKGLGKRLERFWREFFRMEFNQ